MDSDSSLDGEFETKHEIAVQARRNDEAAVVSDKVETEDEVSDEESDGEKDSSPIRSPLPPDRDSNSIKSPLQTDKESNPGSPIRSPLENDRETSPTNSLIASDRDQSPVRSLPDRDSSHIRSPLPTDGDSSPNRTSPIAERDASLIKSPLALHSNEPSPIHSPPPAEKGALSPKSNNDQTGSESDDISSACSIASDSRPASPPEIPVSEDVENSNVDDKDKEENGPSSPVESETEKVSDNVVKRDSDIPGHGEDLSDVSDLDSNDGRDSLDIVSDEEGAKKSPPKGEWKGGVSTAPVEEMEQLDFEAEEQADKEEKEEGECEGGGDKSEDDGELKGDDLEEGELTDEDENRPEETEPRPVCRFYNRGQCTWGSSCRFVHPGVTDKGNYTMFDMVRPLVPVNGPPIYPSVDYRVPYEKPVGMALPYQGPRKEEVPVFESAWERGLRQAKEMMRKSTKRKETDMDFEEKKMNLSLGQEELDKENDYYTRPASPVLKDETDRWGLKMLEPEDSVLVDPYEDFPKSPSAYYHQSGARGGGDYWRRVHYEPGDSRAMRIETDYGGSSRKYHSHQHRAPPSEYYEKKKKATHPVREVIMQRTEKPWRDERYAEISVPSHRGRGDEWADPWMRSKSPTTRKTGSGSRPSRRQSYSSGSSYSTSSSSRSSSQSSYSSYSRDSHSRSHSKSLSRSRSRSSSRTPLSRSRRKVNRPLVPTARASEALSPTFQPISPRKVMKQPDPRSFTKVSLIQSEKKAASERALLMNPPAPSPRKQKEVRPPSPGMMRKSAQNPPAPSSTNTRAKLALERSKAVVAAALSSKVKLRSRSKSSHSSSGSDSSGSSSDSSETSYSSSSSSREPSPKAVRAPKRIVIDERERLALAQSLKVKAMDALKLSGQKQQIKLTLKAPGATVPAPGSKRPITGLPELPELNLVRRERIAPAIVAGKKRTIHESVAVDMAFVNKVAAMANPASKKATSRREELLKQLKAVEDAIARKKSKI